MNLRAMLLGACLLSISCVDPRTTYASENKEIHAAMRRLWKDNPESLQILKDVHAKGIHLKIELGELKGAVLGVTLVKEDSATITIDVTKVYAARDNLVPVLAHEIYHVRDAFIVLGFDTFVATANNEQDLTWYYRSLEVRAIKSEDALRKKLLSLKSKDYQGMASNRAEANRRAEEFGRL